MRKIFEQNGSINGKRTCIIAQTAELTKVGKQRGHGQFKCDFLEQNMIWRFSNLKQVGLLLRNQYVAESTKKHE